MYKKILISTLLGASLSFATWGYFPLKESDSGLEIRANHFIGFGDNDPHYLNADVRYVLGTSLEVALLNVGIQFSDPSGLQNPLFSVRYQLGQKALVFGEITVPIGQASHPEFIHVGYQQAFVLNQHLAWSSEIGYKNYFSEDADGTTKDHASSVNISMEADYNTTPSLIWFVGEDLEMNISDGDSYSESAFNFGFKIFGGASYELKSNMHVQEEISFMPVHSGTYFDGKSLAFKTSLKYAF